LIAKGWRVKGSTTSHDKLEILKSHGIDGYVIDLPSQDRLVDALFDAEVLLLNIPPRRSSPELVKNYPRSIEEIMNKTVEIGSVRYVIFVSSTSVYGEGGDIINESTSPAPSSASGQAILQAEHIVRSSGIPNVVLRFGGLAGRGRHPGRFLAGKSGIRSGHQAVNMLHLTDAMSVIEYIIRHQIFNQVYNVVSPTHPTKRAFYTSMAKQLDLQAPGFLETHEGGKREISVDKLLSETNFDFAFPNPMEFTFH
jgi:nucleoside-diphosphate-sugar epimerase